MIIKSIGIGNLEERYICSEFDKALIVLLSVDNNTGKPFVLVFFMFCLGITPAFPTGFEYEDYYYVLVIEQNSELIKICRKNKNFVIKINNEYAVFDNISEFKRYWNKNIEELPVIKKDNVWRIVDPELFVQLFFVGQDKKNTYDIVNKGWYKKEDFYKLIYWMNGIKDDVSLGEDIDKVKRRITDLKNEKGILLKENKILNKTNIAMEYLSNPNDRMSL